MKAGAKPIYPRWQQSQGSEIERKVIPNFKIFNRVILLGPTSPLRLPRPAASAGCLATDSYSGLWPPPPTSTGRTHQLESFAPCGRQLSLSFLRPAGRLPHPHSTAGPADKLTPKSTGVTGAAAAAGATENLRRGAPMSWPGSGADSERTERAKAWYGSTAAVPSVFL
jgi:hypothetical protein